ncbi:hypothetical protein K4F52_000464 [Lecanicillium sp. MT-2017a]|nr:hypothetical protein K4F52_000464 [Lecanicillium sp. MT-2017a]
MSALMHLAYAKRVLTASELSDVLALAQSGTSLNAKYRPTAKMILQCCQGLAMLDRETNQMRLAHYAIHEYLVTNAETIFPQIGVRLALDCLRYLLLDDFKDGAYVTEEAMASRIEAYPFHPYASRHCGGYARHEEMHPDVWNALYDLYASRESLAAAIQSMRFAKGYHEGYYNAVECSSFTPVHYAAQQGLINSVRMLLERGLATANDRTDQGSTPIILAASNGHAATVQLLLKDHGADPRLSNWYGNALQCAVESGQVKVVRQLVEWGMDPNGEPAGDPDGDGCPPLACALDHDSAAVFELLVDLGARIKIDLHPEGESDSADVFCLACYWGCERIAELMLRRGWVDVRRSGPARFAVRGVSLRVLSRLRLRLAGADVNIVDDAGSTPLWYARQVGDQVEVDILLGDEAESDAMDATNDG